MTEETVRMLNGKLITDAVASTEEPTELSHLTRSIICPVLEKNSIVEYGGVTKTNALTTPKQEGKKLFQFLATLVGKYKAQFSYLVNTMVLKINVYNF